MAVVKQYLLHNDNKDLYARRRMVVVVVVAVVRGKVVTRLSLLFHGLFFVCLINVLEVIFCSFAAHYKLCDPRSCGCYRP